VIRRRFAFIALACLTIGVGLVVHSQGASLGHVARDILGDALWATMIAWWLGAVAPGSSVWTRGAVAYAVCAVVEISQLYHTPALDALRATPLGRLTLGSGFDPRDLLVYGFGVGAAVAREAFVVVLRRRSRVRQRPDRNSGLYN
jgi:hypothetical protein